MWKFKISKRNDDSSRKLALEGNCVLTPVYPISENLEKTEKQLGKLKEANFKRIELSNSIRVKNNLLTIILIDMKKKLYILGLVVILGLGGAYAIAGNSDTNVCFWKGRAYQPGEVWEEVVNGVTYRYTCKENGEIVVSPLP